MVVAAVDVVVVVFVVIVPLIFFLLTNYTKMISLEDDVLTFESLL